MYTIEVMMRASSMAIAVQKKEADAAQALYQQITTAQNTGTPKVLELTCDKDEGKKVTILTQEVVAVQVSEKSGGASTSAAASFFGINATN